VQTPGDIKYSNISSRRSHPLRIFNIRALIPFNFPSLSFRPLPFERPLAQYFIFPNYLARPVDHFWESESRDT
jgi:hypothetical protein